MSSLNFLQQTIGFGKPLLTQVYIMARAGIRIVVIPIPAFALLRFYSIAAFFSVAIKPASEPGVAHHPE